MGKALPQGNDRILQRRIGLHADNAAARANDP
jgi:hypothetical protein